MKGAYMKIDHKECVVDGNGNGKPRVGKKKNQEEKGQVEMLSLRRSTHVEKCPKKSALKEKPMGTTLVLGSSAKGVESKEAESDKKSVEYFLCHGPHRLRKCSRKSDIEGNNGADKEPKKLGSSKGKVEAKRAKMSKKKLVKCFLCHGLHELQNCP
ncbi:hypothetical protein Gotri_003969, partial [Gossypium trilobum]|nr:hypothetical protein [Gossypium trilobum]